MPARDLEAKLRAYACAYAAWRAAAPPRALCGRLPPEERWPRLDEEEEVLEYVARLTAAVHARLLAAGGAAAGGGGGGPAGTVCCSARPAAAVARACVPRPAGAAGGTGPAAGQHQRRPLLAARGQAMLPPLELLRAAAAAAAAAAEAGRERQRRRQRQRAAIVLPSIFVPGVGVNYERRACGPGGVGGGGSGGSGDGDFDVAALQEGGVAFARGEAGRGERGDNGSPLDETAASADGSWW